MQQHPGLDTIPGCQPSPSYRVFNVTPSDSQLCLHGPIQAAHASSFRLYTASQICAMNPLLPGCQSRLSYTVWCHSLRFPSMLIPVESLSPSPPTVAFRYPISLCPLASVHGPIQAVHSSSFRPVHSPLDLCYESPSLVANLAQVMQSGVTSSDPQTTCGVETIPILPLPLSATPFTLHPMALVHRPV
ncbi:hypothetical protein BKA82DRAFT_4015635 [Pisolithus tinctorius]|nr:hypothetical protein BKA82DRAFT_4015635 [Pisolithus tinctorius]